MDGAQLYAVFNRIPILKNKFLGILTFKEICENIIHLDWAKRDFILINFRNLHWILIIWTNVDTVIIFDSLSGKLMLKKGDGKDSFTVFLWSKKGTISIWRWETAGKRILDVF